MAVTINTFSNFGNQPVTIQIDGTTPAGLALTSLKIDYSDNEVADYIIDWKGSISFFGRTELYDEFGVIKHKSHKITIDYGTDKQFVGYLLPEVYNIPNTGFEEEFTLNFESSLSTLSRELFTESTNLYSIQYILDKMLELTGIQNVEVKKSFILEFYVAKIYSANFFNDDSKNENYLTILEWICTTFSMKCLMGWDNVLYLTSFELLNGSDPYSLEGHLGINEDYSVSKTIETVSVNVSNFAMPELPANFDLQGSVKVSDQPKMQIRRGKRRLIGKKGSWHQYWRQLYQFNPGQNAWKFNKYDSSWNALSDTDIFDSTKYMNGTIPLAGAYPYAWASLDKDGTGFNGFEQAIWFKGYNNANLVWNNKMQEMITLQMDNVLIPRNTFLATSFNAMANLYTGTINQWSYSNWHDSYDAKESGGFSDNIDEGVVQISPSIPTPYAQTPKLSMSIIWNEIGGTMKYWDAKATIPNWTTDSSKKYFTIDIDAENEFEFGSAKGNMTSPCFEDGTPANFDGGLSSDVWCRFPTTMGSLSIAFGFSAENAGIESNILFRGLNFEYKQAISDVTDINLAQMDLIYSNLDQFDQVNAEYDKTTTFYMYSDNEASGRGQLFLFDADHRLQYINYDNPIVISEKPEEHYIRLATKWESNAKIYNDIIPLDDMKMGYEDRFFNGGNLDLVEGIANVQLISCNKEISGDL